jgi:hypothetical protein
MGSLQLLLHETPMAGAETVVCNLKLIEPKH